jgi:hypothetical protein
MKGRALPGAHDPDSSAIWYDGDAYEAYPDEQIRFQHTTGRLCGPPFRAVPAGPGVRSQTPGE